jgi:ATP/maltotriose-dependent transcriptional regulator MalT
VLDLYRGRNNRAVTRPVSSPDFIGRDPELAALLAGYGQAQDGQARAFFVAGEAGVGKTRLVEEFARRAETEGARALRGDCPVLAHGELPFAPLTAALRPLAKELSETELNELAGAGREELSHLIPELSQSTASSPITSDALGQARLFELLLDLLTRLAAQQPVVLVIEDLHWADRSTRDFLSFLIRNAREARLVLVCTYRSDELHRKHPLRPFLAEEERREPVQRLELQRLTQQELARLLEGILGEPPDAQLLQRLYERSEGNAFFAEELLASSEDAQGPLPPTVTDALMLRVESLTPPTQQMLRVAAVAGRRTTHPLLAAAANQDPDDLLQSLREAVAQNILVREGETYAFRHAVLRESVYEDLLPGERGDLHVRLAEALAADPSLSDTTGSARAGELAHHWWEARRLPEALAASVAAGKAAERSYAFAEAQRHFENALEIWNHVPDAEERAGADRAEVTGWAAEYAYRMGDDDRAISLARDAMAEIDAKGDTVQSALQRERLGRYLWVSGDSEAAERTYREALEMMPAEPPTRELAEVTASLGQALMLRGRFKESVELCERAIEVARQVGERRVEGHALNTLGSVVGMQGDRERGFKHQSEAIEIAEELDLIEDHCRAYVNIAETVDEDGRTQEAIDLTFKGVEVARSLGAQTYVTFLQAEGADRIRRLGRLGEVEALVTDALAHGAGGSHGVALLHSVRAATRIARGDEEGAAEALMAAEEVGRTLSDSMWTGPMRADQVNLSLLRDQPEEAAKLAEETISAFDDRETAYFTSGLYHSGLRAFAALAERARALGDDAAAEQLAARARPLVERLRTLLGEKEWAPFTPPPDSLAALAATEGELARVEGRDDPEIWSDAVARYEELGYPAALAYTRMREAEARLASESGRDRATELLREAAEGARAIGAAPLLGEIEALARRARVKLGQSPDGNGDEPAPAADSELDAIGLTDREIEVLELLAEGKTNREIGETLFMAEKTASVHVSRILGKLGVRGRVEAATAAYRLGISRDASTT